MVVGQVQEPGERFTFVFPRFSETLDFTRRSRQNAPGFFPRRSPESPSALPAPIETQDGWQTAAPRETGLDEEPLARLVGSIAAFEPTEPALIGLVCEVERTWILPEIGSIWSAKLGVPGSVPG